jgi:hypothetical protein
MTAYQEGIYIAANILLRVNVSDGGECWADLLYVQGPGLPPLLVNRLPIPQAALADVAAMLARAAERVAG